MRAGLLRDVAVFSKLVITTSVSGAKKRSYEDYLTTRCCKKKLSSALGNGVNIHEEFIANSLVIQVRYNPLIISTDRVLYNGTLFSVTLLDRQVDNTYLVTLTKVNV